MTHDTIPAGEVGIRRGDPCTPRTGRSARSRDSWSNRAAHVTHVLLQEGHLWGRKRSPSRSAPSPRSRRDVRQPPDPAVEDAAPGRPLRPRAAERSNRRTSRPRFPPASRSRCASAASSIGIVRRLGGSTRRLRPARAAVQLRPFLGVVPHEHRKERDPTGQDAAPS